MAEAKKSVLIVEDDALLQSVLKAGFEKAGMRVFGASNVEEATKSIRDNAPSLVLLDILLPGQDGFSLLRNMKRDASTRNIPVIIISNLGSSADVSKGKELGAADYFIKAKVSLDDLIANIKGYLKQ